MSANVESNTYTDANVSNNVTIRPADHYSTCKRHRQHPTPSSTNQHTGKYVCCCKVFYGPRQSPYCLDFCNVNTLRTGAQWSHDSWLSTALPQNLRGKKTWLHLARGRRNAAWFNCTWAEYKSNFGKTSGHEMLPLSAARNVVITNFQEEKQLSEEVNISELSKCDF